MQLTYVLASGVIFLISVASLFSGMLQKPIATLPVFRSSVQAVAFAPSLAGSGGGLHCLAVGLEDGGLQVKSLQLK